MTVTHVKYTTGRDTTYQINIHSSYECHNPFNILHCRLISLCTFPIRRGGNELRMRLARWGGVRAVRRPAGAAHATTTPHRKFRLRYWLCEPSRSHAHLITYISPQRSSCPVALASSSKYSVGLTVKWFSGHFRWWPMQYSNQVHISLKTTSSLDTKYVFYCQPSLISTLRIYPTGT